MLTKTTLRNKLLVESLSEVEKRGMIHVINKHFEPLVDSPTFVDDNYGYFTDCPEQGTRKLTIQDKSFQLEEGVHLSHFLLTTDHDVVAVGYDESDEEIHYFLT